MDDIKTQLSNRLKEANNVLVSVKNDPSVDQFAAAIALTLILNKLGKHATTVFSGTIPSTIQFLQPEKIVEKNTDSLRDFIISLDKTKADKLRYKIEDNFVKIFITPYHTSISQTDLVFSQGDFNVDVVVGLGVHQREELDQAITAHGRILHDATVTTINTTPPSNLGSINWSDSKSSSLCEMLVGLLDLLAKQGILDPQISNALLTGIVAETQRFSNLKTTSQTMAASSKLLEAGANQQLVSTQLTPKPVTPPTPAPSPENTVINDKPKTAELDQPLKQIPTVKKSQAQDGTLQIHHMDNPYDNSKNDEDESQVTQVLIDEQGILKTIDPNEKPQFDESKSDQLPPVNDISETQSIVSSDQGSPPISPPENQNKTNNLQQSVDTQQDSTPNSTLGDKGSDAYLSSNSRIVLKPPTMGEQHNTAMDDEADVDIFNGPQAASENTTQPESNNPPLLSHDQFINSNIETNNDAPSETIQSQEQQTVHNLDEVRSAVNAALSTSPSVVANQPLESLNAQTVNLGINNPPQTSSIQIPPQTGGALNQLKNESSAPPVPPPIIPLNDIDPPSSSSAL